MTVWRLRFECWITKATNTDSECVINIAFPPQNGWANVSKYYIMRTFPSGLKMNYSTRYFEFGMGKEVSNFGHYIMRNLVNIAIFSCDDSEV
jgi:hypothetical protein